jgi:hypothetical protein
MEQEEIERIILRAIDCDSLGLRNVNQAAAAIAEAVDEEFAEAITNALDSYIIQLDARHELNDELRAENTQLLAQLAKMREALNLVEDYYCHKAKHDHFAGIIEGYYSEDEVLSKVYKALSDVPEAEIKDRLTARLEICENGLRACGQEYDKLLARQADMAWAIEEMLRALDEKADFDASVEHLEKALAATREVKSGRED